MDKENVVHVHNGVLFSSKVEDNNVFWRKVYGIRDHYIEEDKPRSERQGSWVSAHMQTKQN
jgi:hypothetical protein